MSEAKHPSSAGAFETAFRVGKYTCEMSYSPGGGLKAEWSAMPKKMSDDMWREYRSGRNSLFAEVAKAIGGAVLVVEA